LYGSGGVESLAVSTLHGSIQKIRQKFVTFSTAINFSPLSVDVATSLFIFIPSEEMDDLIDFHFVAYF